MTTHSDSVRVLHCSAFHAYNNLPWPSRSRRENHRRDRCDLDCTDLWRNRLVSQNNRNPPQSRTRFIKGTDPPRTHCSNVHVFSNICRITGNPEVTKSIRTTSGLATIRELRGKPKSSVPADQKKIWNSETTSQCPCRIS